MNWANKLTRLVLVHMAVVALSPAVAAILFLCLNLELGSSMHFGGVLAFAFGTLFSYIFYGAKTLLFVLLASPIFWGLAKIKSGLVAFVLAVIIGGGLGWCFCLLLLAGEDQTFVTRGSLATMITGALAAAALEFAWRGCPFSKSDVPAK